MQDERFKELLDSVLPDYLRENLEIRMDVKCDLGECTMKLKLLLNGEVIAKCKEHFDVDCDC